MRTNIAYGWPVVALWHGHQWIVADIGGTLYQSDVWGGFDLGPPPQDPTGFPRVLPYRPIWLGMLINTLFYAILLYLAIAGSGALRRLIRLKRGRCPRCGYDLRGALQAGCPECGWNRQPEATT